MMQKNNTSTKTILMLAPCKKTPLYKLLLQISPKGFQISNAIQDCNMLFLKRCNKCSTHINTDIQNRMYSLLTEYNQYINLAQCFSSKKRHPEQDTLWTTGKKKSKLAAASTDTQKHLSASHFYI